MILKVKNLTKRFGGTIAVNDCSFELEENAIVGLIGPNGSGKTTIFNLILNILNPDNGEVYFKNRRIDNEQTFKIARMGISRTFQILKLFWKLTVLQNMNLASLYKRKERWEERALELLDFVGLLDLKDEYAENLSFGQQKLLEFALALMPDPDFLMLDEPVAGVNPRLIDRIVKYIKELRDEGKTFFVIEHNIPFVMRVCDIVIVLDHGEKIAEGPAREIRHNQKVIDAYLGSL